MIIELYKTLMTLSFPLIKATYVKKRQRIGKEHPTRFNERLAQYTYPRPEGKLYWLHGASVGESISMLPLIKKLLDEDKDLHIMVTTGTLTSAEIMQKRLPERAFHQFIPFDVPKFAKNLINHFRPNAVLWFESELWPSLLSEIKKRNIPLILVNGRISDKSYRKWQRFKPFSSELLGCFSLCLGQSEQDKNRLKILGAKKAACFGNLKFAGLTLPVDKNVEENLKASVNNRPVFLISSTHHNEEEQFSLHLHTLQKAVDNIFILVVPRHPERGAAITEMLRQKGFDVSQRSKNEPITDKTEIYVADTIGEMGLWYNLSQVTFIGGSLINHGGQNFIEPARSGNAVLLGQYMHNFAEMLTNAKVADAVYQFASAADIVDKAIELYRDADYLNERRQKAKNWAEAEAKVLDKITQALVEELK